MGLTFNPELDIIDTQTQNSSETRLDLTVVMTTFMKETKEEVQLLSTADLIGSIGGSLGLFFGFTIAPNIDIIIEKILNWIFPRNQ